MADSTQWNVIRHEDCLSGMASLPEGCAALVFADPPFNIGYDYDVYDDDYAGGSLNLRKRLEQQFGSEKQLAQWRQWSEPLSVRVFALDPEPLLLLAYQSRMVRTYLPCLNFLELAAV